MRLEYVGLRNEYNYEVKGKKVRYAEIVLREDNENDYELMCEMMPILKDYGWDMSGWCDVTIDVIVSDRDDYEDFRLCYLEAKKQARENLKNKKKAEKAKKETSIDVKEEEETKEEVKKIDGHDYTIETMNPKGTRKYYHFNDRNSKGEKIDIEFDKVENDYKGHMINVWYKNGFIKERLKSYWHITVYATDQKGFTWGRYNPQILPGGTKINFNWILEATEENKERILHEIIKRAYNGKIENI